MFLSEASSINSEVSVTTFDDLDTEQPNFWEHLLINSVELISLLQLVCLLFFHIEIYKTLPMQHCYLPNKACYTETTSQLLEAL